MPDYVALIDLYTASNSINKAKELLSKIPQDTPQYTCSIKYLYYQIYNAEKNYKEALANLEEYVNMLDSIIYADNQSKILNIESKYNHLKISKEVDRLKIKQQKLHYNFNYQHCNVTVYNGRIPIISQKSKRKNSKTTG